MKTLLLLTGMIFLLLAGTQECQATTIIAGRATITHTDLAGGFWGIISEQSYDGTHYFDPVFMPLRFRHEGLHVWFLAVLLPYVPNIYMWGNPVFIIKMIRWI